MKSIISSLVLATILATPLAALADGTAPASTTPAQPKASAMQQEMTPSEKRVDEVRDSASQTEYQSRQLGPTN